jgi:hypothetical protein
MSEEGGGEGGVYIEVSHDSLRCEFGIVDSSFENEKSKIGKSSGLLCFIGPLSEWSLEDNILR